MALVTGLLAAATWVPLGARAPCITTKRRCLKPIPMMLEGFQDKAIFCKFSNATTDQPKTRIKCPNPPHFLAKNRKSQKGKKNIVFSGQFQASLPPSLQAILGKLAYQITKPIYSPRCPKCVLTELI